MFKFLIKQAYIKGFKEGTKEGIHAAYKKWGEGKRNRLVSENLRVFGEFLNIHTKVLDFAIKVNLASLKKFNPPSTLSNEGILARGCLWKIGGVTN